MTMRAVTLTQPWATCSVVCLPDADPPKQHETRSWPPPKALLPLELAIHAGKVCPPDVRDALIDEGLLVEPYSTIVSLLEYTTRDPWRQSRGQQTNVRELPLAAVVGVVTVTKVYKTTGVSPESFDGDLGDFTIGRFAWKMENAIALHRPVPCRGFQGIWQLPDDVERLVREQLAQVRAA